MQPLVSILIPAYNAADWIAETIQSAIGQTWPRKEIIVVDDGSKDRTAEVARRFASKQILVVSKENQGAAAARNHALHLSQGDYIQWLDADDLLAPDKVEAQIAGLRECDGKRTLLSSSWACFNYRPQRARFIPTPLWQDLSPVEWLFRKIAKNLHMQTATWLTNRELSEAAGPWDTRLLSDDDGEYFCRVLLASGGTRFVPEAKVFWRNTPSDRLGHIGASNKKREATVVSMKLHIQYLRSLEESGRVQSGLPHLYAKLAGCICIQSGRILVAELQEIAAELHGKLEAPRLRWKYAWMRPIFGRRASKQAQIVLPQVKASLIRRWDKAMYRVEKL